MMIGFCAMLLFMGCVYLLLISPNHHQQESLEQDIAAKRTDIARIQQQLNAKRQLASRIEKLTGALGAFQTQLEGSRQTDRVLADLCRGAELNQLQTCQIRTPAGRTIDIVREQEIDLTVTGSFGGLYQFLLDIEQSNRVLRINKLDVTKLPGREGFVQAALALKVYAPAESGSVCTSN